MMEAIKIANDNIPRSAPKRKKPQMSEWLEGFLQDRETALEQGDLEEAEEITKPSRNSNN